VNITKFQAEEMLHKLTVLAENDDRELSDTQERDLAFVLQQLRGPMAREVFIPVSITQCVIDELRDHLAMLREIPAHDHPQAAIRSIETLINKLEATKDGVTSEMRAAFRFKR
jgi:hypothetical protein